MSGKTQINQDANTENFAKDKLMLLYVYKVVSLQLNNLRNS